MTESRSMIASGLVKLQRGRKRLLGMTVTFTILIVVTVSWVYIYAEHIRLSTFNMCCGFISITSQYKCLNSDGKVIRSQILKYSKEAKGPDIFQQTLSKMSSSAHCMTNSKKSQYWNMNAWCSKKVWQTYTLKISLRKELWPICHINVSSTLLLPLKCMQIPYLAWKVPLWADIAPNNCSPAKSSEGQSVPKVGHQISGWH